jgi:hypothetical protein
MMFQYAMHSHGQHFGANAYLFGQSVQLFICVNNNHCTLIGVEVFFDNIIGVEL